MSFSRIITPIAYISIFVWRTIRIVCTLSQRCSCHQNASNCMWVIRKDICLVCNFGVLLIYRTYASSSIAIPWIYGFNATTLTTSVIIYKINTSRNGISSTIHRIDGNTSWCLLEGGIVLVFIPSPIFASIILLSVFSISSTVLFPMSLIIVTFCSV